MLPLTPVSMSQPALRCTSTVRAKCSPMPVSFAYHRKMEVYRRAGAKEYIVWRTLDQQIDRLQLVAGQYVQREPDGRGFITSEVFPGLRLVVSSMLAGDRAGVLAGLRAGT